MPQKIFDKPFFVFLPFLLLYVIIVLIQYSDMPFGDEARYFMFAGNLLEGFYSPPPPGINLWNGPGFPLYLVPFIALGIPTVVIKLCNAFLLFGSLVVFNRTLRLFIDSKKAFFISVLFGLYYMPYKGLPHVLSETFVIFLVSVITYAAARYFSPVNRSNRFAQTLLLSLLLGFLALTKVIFGPVYLAAIVFFILLFIFTKNIFYRRATVVLFCALLWCSPYLAYTYSLTGKIFYWSDAAGMSLYWMSNPNPGEWGEWQNDSLTTAKAIPGAVEKYRQNHQGIYDDVYQYSGVERDRKFRDYAMANFKAHPGKYFLNWLANCSRMLFNYPNGYTPVRWSTVGNFFANAPVLILMMISLALTWRNGNKIPPVLKFLLIVSGIYLFASSLLSAYDRMFYIMIPVIGLWIAYMMVVLRRGIK